MTGSTAVCHCLLVDVVLLSELAMFILANGPCNFSNSTKETGSTILRGMTAFDDSRRVALE
jgi:hypothetical protein